jgi:hypothetical protein
MRADATRAVAATAPLRGRGPTARIEVPLFSAISGLFHAFTLRDADPAAVVAEALGPDAPLITLRQVHGARVRMALPGGGAVAGLEGDALVGPARGEALGVFVADCAPILIVDERARAVSAVHAGWRGTAAGVLGEAIATLRRELGSRPADLRVAIGPAIGPCCFEVGEEVVEALLHRDPGAGACVRRGVKLTVDLAGANRLQAEAAGVPPAGIAAVALCTRCRGDLFPSWRRDGRAAGRMAGLIGWRT